MDGKDLLSDIFSHPSKVSYTGKVHIPPPPGHSVVPAKMFCMRYPNLQLELNLKQRQRLRKHDGQIEISSARSPDERSLGDTAAASRIAQTYLQKLSEKRAHEKENKDRLMYTALAMASKHLATACVPKQPTSEKPSTRFRRVDIETHRSMPVAEHVLSPTETKIDLEILIPVPLGLKIKSVILCLKFFTIMYSKIERDRASKRAHAQVIKRVLQRNLERKRSKKVNMSSFNFPLKFILDVKRRVKFRASDTLKVFVSEFRSVSGTGSTSYLIKLFFSRIKKIQRLIRGYFKIKKARLEVLEMLWLKQEHLVRTKILAAKKLRALELKEKTANILKRQLKDKSGNTARWHILHTQVVFYEQKMLEACSKFQKHNCMEMINKDIDVTDPKANERQKTDDLVSEEMRRSIIHRALTAKRKMHIALLSESTLSSKFVFFVDERLVHRFLCDDMDAENKIKDLQLSTAVAIKNKERNLFSVEKKMFLCLTGNLGKTWKTIISDAIEVDICSKDAFIVSDS